MSRAEHGVLDSRGSGIGSWGRIGGSCGQDAAPADSQARGVSLPHLDDGRREQPGHSHPVGRHRCHCDDLPSAPHVDDVDRVTHAEAVHPVATSDPQGPVDRVGAQQADVALAPGACGPQRQSGVLPIHGEAGEGAYRNG